MTSVGQVRVLIPEGVAAGTTLNVDVGQGDALCVRVPEGANPGDEVLITKTPGGWIVAGTTPAVEGGVERDSPRSDDLLQQARDRGFEDQISSTQARCDRLKAEKAHLVEEYHAERARERPCASPRGGGATTLVSGDVAQAALAEADGSSMLRSELARRDEQLRHRRSSGGAENEGVSPRRSTEVEELRAAVAERDAEIARLRSGFELLGREIVRLHGALRSASEARRTKEGALARSDGLGATAPSGVSRPLGVVPDWGSAEKRPPSTSAAEVRNEAQRIEGQLAAGNLAGTHLAEAVGGLRRSIVELEDALGRATEDFASSASTSALLKHGSLRDQLGEPSSGLMPATAMNPAGAANVMPMTAPWPCGNMHGSATGRSPSPAARQAKAAPAVVRGGVPPPVGWQHRPSGGGTGNARVVHQHLGFAGTAVG